ncbi:aldehyde dehydrogenase family protein, partial [Listeria monocytogenes]|nr:aldehyde dehydrogenase family protein [Listeria monocytogenes]
GEVIPSNKPGMFSMAIRRPAGVVLSIAPWNAPVILAVRAFCTALACGNTVVLKASELSPGTQYLLTRVMVEAGLPP